MKHGGILMFKWREVKSIRMSTSFSPGRRFGTEGPEKTSDLKFGNTIHSCLIIFLLPNTVGTLQGQKLGVGLLLVVGHGPGQGVVPLTQVLNLLGQVLDLSLDIGHVSWFIEDAMEIRNGGIFMFQGYLEFPKENILVSTDLNGRVWYKVKLFSVSLRKGKSGFTNYKMFVSKSYHVSYNF